MAESEGFEPPDPFGSTVFKTAAFDRSASSPLVLFVVYPYLMASPTAINRVSCSAADMARDMRRNRMETLAYYNHLHLRVIPNIRNLDLKSVKNTTTSTTVVY